MITCKAQGCGIFHWLVGQGVLPGVGLKALRGIRRMPAFVIPLQVLY